MNTATWYVLEDGSAADPSDVSPDKEGVLRHRGGMAVAMRGDVPRSRSVDVEAEMKKATQKQERAKNAPLVDAAAEKAPAIEKAKGAASNREMKAGKSKKYETR